MAAVLLHLEAAALGARVKAFLEHAALDEDCLHLERVDVGAVVVLGIGDRRLEQLAQERRAFFRGEGEDVHRLVDRLAADHVGDQPPFLGGKPRAAQDGFRFHHFFPAGAAGAAPGAPAAGAAGAAPGPVGPGAGLRSPPTAPSVRLPTAEWLLKKRVRANPPSLWPTMFSSASTG